MIKSIIGTALALALAAGAAFAASPSSVTAKMQAQNKSGETGTATLTQTAAGVKVVVSIQGAPAAAQPMHVHPGTCAKLNPAPKYPLNPLVNGKSTSTIKDVKLTDLTGGKFAINVHKSTSDIATYVSCGDIK